MKALIAFLLLLPAIAVAQKRELKSWWTNGYEFYYQERIEDSILHFEGGTLHEGGSRFYLLKKKDGQLFICKHPQDDYTSWGEFGDPVEYKIINNTKVLILKNKNNEIKGLLIDRKSGDSIKKGVTSIKTNHELAGKYQDPFSKKEVVFFPDKQIATGLSKSTTYEFEDDYDIPTEVISFSKKESYYYEVTDYGLDIFKAYQTQSADWEKGKKLMSLIKTSWLNSELWKGINGNYPFTSSVILIDAILNCYTKQQLGIMRNEIFARHGLIFKTEEVRTYFSKQSWYKPEFENVDDKLTDLEKLNVQLIQLTESRTKGEN